MTRQKKELKKRIEELDEIIYVEENCFGYFVSADDLRDERNELLQQLVELMHYDNIEDYLFDNRYPLVQY